MGMYLALLAIGQVGLDAKIDFKPPIAPLHRTLVELEKATGTKLRATPTLGKEVVAVIAEKQSGQEIMERLAHVLHAEWKKGGSEYTLFRSERKQQELWIRHVDLREEALRRAIEALPKPKPEDISALSSQVRNLIEQSANGQRGNPAIEEGLLARAPVRALAHELLHALPLHKLAALPDRTRIVFSSAPNKMQSPLPASWKGSFATFADRHNKLVSSTGVESMIRKPAQDAGASAFERFRPVEADAEVLLAFQESPEGHAQVSLTIIGKDDHIAASSRIQLSTRRPTPPAPADPTPIVLRDDTKTLTAFRMSQDTEEVIPEPEIRALRFPEEDEPLRYGNHEALTAMSNHRAKPLVAVLDDRTWTSYVPDWLTVGRYEQLNQLNQFFGEREGWIEISAKDPYDTELRRLDRRAAGTFIRRQIEEGRVSLENFADFIRGLKVSFRSLSPSAAMPFHRMGAAGDWSEHEGLVKLATSLADSDWTKFDSVDASTLSEPNRNVFETALTSEQTLQMLPPRLSLDRFSEPTEMIPNGLVSPIRITFRRRPESTLLLLDQGNTYPVPVELVAHSLAKLERPDLWPGHKAVGTFQRGACLSYRAEYSFAPDLQATIRFDDIKPYPGSKPFPPSDIPADLTDEIKAAKDIYLERFKGLTREDLKRLQNPPPPKVKAKGAQKRSAAIRRRLKAARPGARRKARMAVTEFRTPSSH